MNKSRKAAKSHSLPAKDISQIELKTTKYIFCLFRIIIKQRPNDCHDYITDYMKTLYRQFGDMA